MSIANIGGFGPALPNADGNQTRQNLPGNGTDPSFADLLNTGFVATDYSPTRTNMAANPELNALQQAKAYFDESPAQRMESDWLSQHGLTLQQFEALPPAEQKKLIEEMKQDIESKLRQKMEGTIGGSAALSGAATA